MCRRSPRDTRRGSRRTDRDRPLADWVVFRRAVAAVRTRSPTSQNHAVGITRVEVDETHGIVLHEQHVGELGIVVGDAVGERVPASPTPARRPVRANNATSTSSQVASARPASVSSNGALQCVEPAAQIVEVRDGFYDRVGIEIGDRRVESTQQRASGPGDHGRTHQLGARAGDPLPCAPNFTGLAVRASRPQ